MTGFSEKPKALDLFCGGGGVCIGLQRAGFDVVGIDTTLQPDYPGTFLLADALNPPVSLWDFDFVWASPPCQFATEALNNNPDIRETHTNLLPATRNLIAPHPLTCIENVPGAKKAGPMRADLMLDGPAFENLALLRKRIFELSFAVAPPLFNAMQLPKSGITVHASGSSRFGAGYHVRKRWSFFTQEHIDWIAENTPAFYRKHFPGLVMAAGSGRKGFHGSAFDGRRKNLGLSGTTSLSELQAGLDVWHITSGTKQERRHRLNQCIPPAYSEWIGRAALRLIEKSPPSNITRQSSPKLS